MPEKNRLLGLIGGILLAIGAAAASKHTITEVVIADAITIPIGHHHHSHTTPDILPIAPHTKTLTRTVTISAKAPTATADTGAQVFESEGAAAERVTVTYALYRTVTESTTPTPTRPYYGPTNLAELSSQLPRGYKTVITLPVADPWITPVISDMTMGGTYTLEGLFNAGVGKPIPAPTAKTSLQAVETLRATKTFYVTESPVATSTLSRNKHTGSPTRSYPPWWFSTYTPTPHRFHTTTRSHSAPHWRLSPTPAVVSGTDSSFLTRLPSSRIPSKSTWASTSHAATATPDPTVPDSIGPIVLPDSFSLLGCFSDPTEMGLPRPLDTLGKFSSSMSFLECASFCWKYDYFGLENGEECYCSNEVGFGVVPTHDSECNATCLGNSDQKCGGFWRQQLYAADRTDDSVDATSSLSATQSSAYRVTTLPRSSRLRHSHTPLTSTRSVQSRFASTTSSSPVTRGSHSRRSTSSRSSSSSTIRSGSLGKSSSSSAKSLFTSSRTSVTSRPYRPSSSAPLPPGIPPLPSSYVPPSAESTNGPEPAKAFGSFRYLYCAIEPFANSANNYTGRSLNGYSELVEHIDSQVCADICSDYKYLGVGSTNECYCSDTIATGTGKDIFGGCNLPCSNNKSEACGGDGRLNLAVNLAKVIGAASAAASSEASEAAAASVTSSISTSFATPGSLIATTKPSSALNASSRASASWSTSSVTIVQTGSISAAKSRTGSGRGKGSPSSIATTSSSLVSTGSRSRSHVTTASPSHLHRTSRSYVATTPHPTTASLPKSPSLLSSVSPILKTASTPSSKTASTPTVKPVSLTTHKIASTSSSITTTSSSSYNASSVSKSQLAKATSKPLPIADPVSTDLPCGLRNKPGSSLFKMRTRAITGTPAEFDNLYLEKVPYLNSSKTQAALLTNNSNAAFKAYFAPPTRSIALHQGACAWSGLSLLRDADRDTLGPVVVTGAVGTSRMDIAGGEVVWDNDRFGGWVACRVNSKRVQLWYWDVVANDVAPGAAGRCARITVMTEFQ